MTCIPSEVYPFTVAATLSLSLSLFLFPSLYIERASVVFVRTSEDPSPVKVYRRSLIRTRITQAYLRLAAAARGYASPVLIIA